MKKKCNRCSVRKDISDYAINKHMPDGHRKICKACCNIYNKEYYKNPDKRNKMKNQTFTKKYGLSLEQINKMLIAQDNKCAICKVHKDEAGKRGMMVDHCHTTNKVREMLCANCNVILGMCYDNPQILIEAITYLEKHKG